MSRIIQVTTDTFESEVLSSSIPVLIDLYADWCMPCRMMAPIIERLAGEMDGQIKFAKVDVEANPDLAAAFRASSIPMLVLMQDGKPVQTVVGLKPPEEIKRMLQQLLPATT